MKVYNGKSPVEKRDSWQETPWSEETRHSAAGTYVSGEGITVKLYLKEDGSIGLTEDEKEKPLITVSPYTAIVRNPYSDLFLRLISDEERGIFAIAYGSRMIPRRR